MNALETIIATAITTATGAIVTGTIVAVGKLGAMMRLVESLSASVQAVYLVQPHLIRAMRHYSTALKESGANGSTEKANECLDEADRALDRRLAERVGGAA